MRLLPDGRTTSPDVIQWAGARRRQAARPTATPGSIADISDEPEVFGNPIPGGGEIVDSRLHAAIAQMAQGFAMFSPDQRLIACNDAFRALYALPPELTKAGALFWDILDQGGKMGFVPAVDPIGRDELERLIANGEAWRGVHQVHNGRFISAIHEPLPDRGWISLLEDVTEHRRREEIEMERLREADAQVMRFNAAINNMNQGLSMFDADRCLVTCNDTFIHLYHLPAELACQGTPFVDILRHRQRVGMLEKGETVETALRRVEETVSGGDAFKGVVTMATGQVVMISHQPLADGGWLSTHEDISEQHRTTEIMQFMARHDSLTGLANRPTFLEILADAERGIATGDQMAVFCIDFDRFTEVNDSFGHTVGDAVLAIIGDRMRAEFEGCGIPSRLGGDDFAALVGPLDSTVAALRFAQSLVEALRRPIPVGDMTVFCEASVGIALAPRHGNDANTLMHCAELALSRTKTDRRGACCLFEPDMDIALHRRQSIERGLRSAISDGGLSLSFQPLIALETGRVAGCEALMRWQSPTLGAVSPSEFIPVAEETNLIRDMGVWALETACMEASNWPCHIRVAVNVSPVQFRGDGLVDEVAHALMASGLDPSRLELEITESLFLADDAHNLEMLHRLRQLGVRFALDDFGTGYSSLAYLLRFPFDKVKIDRSIVSVVAEKPEAGAMVGAIVDLCRGLNMLTVAEGIEREDQLEAIRTRGCTEVQGYIFSPPLPQNALREILRHKRTMADWAPPPVALSA